MQRMSKAEELMEDTAWLCLIYRLILFLRRFFFFLHLAGTYI